MKKMMITLIGAVLWIVLGGAMDASAMGRIGNNKLDIFELLGNLGSMASNLSDRADSGAIDYQQACEQAQRLRSRIDGVVAAAGDPKANAAQAGIVAVLDRLCAKAAKPDGTSFVLDVRYIPSLTVELKDKTVLTEKDIALVFVREDPVYELPALKSRTATYTAEEFRNRILGKDPALIPPEQPEPSPETPCPDDAVPVSPEEQAALDDLKDGN